MLNDYALRHPVGHWSDLPYRETPTCYIHWCTTVSSGRVYTLTDLLIGGANNGGGVSGQHEKNIRGGGPNPDSRMSAALLYPKVKARKISAKFENLLTLMSVFEKILQRF